MRLAAASPASHAVIDAARSWRLARDRGQLAQPVLAVRLGAIAGAILAPVLDSLLALFEAAFRRRFDAGRPADGELTGDEERLLGLLDHVDEVRTAGVRPELAEAMRTALRSTRIMLQSVFAAALEPA